jgi:hypothetical protein
MNNEWRPWGAKPLKSSLCGFCAYVRGRGGKTSPHTRMVAHGSLHIHNNKYNNNIYFMGVAGVPSCVGGLA